MIVAPATDFKKSTHSELFPSPYPGLFSLPTLSASVTAPLEGSGPLSCFSHTTLELGSCVAILSHCHFSIKRPVQHTSLSLPELPQEANSILHCSRFLLNYLGRFLDLRRPYLTLSSLMWSGAGGKGSLARHLLSNSNSIPLDPPLSAHGLKSFFLLSGKTVLLH